MQLNIQALKGFSYGTQDILRRFNNKPGFIVPLMNSIRYYSDTQQFQLYNTKKQISAISISSQGNYIVVGQKGYKGQLTTTTLINFIGKNKIDIQQYNYQKTKIDIIGVSANGKYICSVGSSYQNMQTLVLIDTTEQSSLGAKPIYFKQILKKEGRIVDICFSNHNDELLVLVFSNKIMTIQIDKQKKVAKASKVRQFNKAVFNSTDQLLYACSKNGDISQIDIQKNKETRVGPRKRVIISGINFIKNFGENHFVISGAKGFLALIEIKSMGIIIEATLKQQIISFTKFDEKGFAFIATNRATIYKLNGKTLDVEFFMTSHNGRVNDIAFMPGYSMAYATCAGSQIMIWKRQQMKPILKIQLMKKSICHCIQFNRQGNMIFSGWSDDCIRMFSPANGKQLHKLQNCLNGTQVTALCLNNASDKIVAGGQNGLLRIWSLQKKHFGLIQSTLLNHKRQITCIVFSQQDPNQFISGSQDGSFGLWSIQTFELISTAFVCNFIKEIKIISAYQFQCIGSTENIFTFLKSNGEIKHKLSIGGSGSYLNSYQKISFSLYQAQFIFAGGQLPYIFCYSKDENIQVPPPLEVYGQVIKIKLSPDSKTLVVCTKNGGVFQIGIKIDFSSKQNA